VKRARLLLGADQRGDHATRRRRMQPVPQANQRADAGIFGTRLQIARDEDSNRHVLGRVKRRQSDRQGLARRLLGDPLA